MKIAYVLSAGLLAAAVSAGAASAATDPYSGDKDVLDGTMEIFSYLMTDETSAPQDLEEVVAQPSVVPLPAAGWLLLAGVAGLAALRRRASA